VTSLALFLVALAAYGVSFWKDPEKTKRAALVGYRMFVNLVPTLLGVTALVGLVMALIPPESLKRLFEVHGAVGFLAVSLVGAVATMPAPIAFPLAGSLLDMGVSLPALAAFITTLTMVGTATAPLEVKYFGRRFTLVRQGLSFILAIMVGGLMGIILR
jgi:uncharacterized membrane protein YraQ (UPF0718 family)